MPRIKEIEGIGKHCHTCGIWMPRRALRKEGICPNCNHKILVRGKQESYKVSRCIECDSILLDAFMVCETCGLDTPYGLLTKQKRARLERAKELSLLAKEKYQKLTQRSQSPDVFQDLKNSQEDSLLIEASLIEESNSQCTESTGDNQHYAAAIEDHLQEQEKIP